MSSLLPGPFVFGDFLVEPEQNQLIKDGELILMERRNMEVLVYLAQRSESVISADELLNELWADRVVEESTIHRRISQLRKTLGDSASRPRYIKTISKRGYQAIARISYAQQSHQILKNRFLLDAEPLSKTDYGDVYRALDLRQQEDGVANPYVAIKMINDADLTPDIRSGLTETTSKTRQLVHQNIMNVWDFDRDGDIVFVTMPLLDGVKLDELLQETPTLAEDEARSIIKQICEGIACAHQHGIVHGAFRPGTIFYTADKIAKVFDFEVPVIPDSNEYGSGSSDPHAYASPNVLAGMTATVQDDIFALAIVTWQLLTGRHPFEFKSVREFQGKIEGPEKLQQLMTSVMNGEVTSVAEYQERLTTIT